ncbi:MAG: FKBP-type peptidyl-prolyl cis-trans isomerase [bacterium]|nr:FKBP-type peptidyl-prolyl cis-trans isomerase [bacterium]
MIKKKKARGRALRNKFIWLLTATLVLSATACSSDKKETNDTAKTEVATTAAPTEVPKTKVTTQNGEVSLGDYKNLKDEKDIDTVTDEEIQDEINVLIQDYVKQKEVKRKSREGDIVELNLIGTADDELIFDYEEEVAQVLIGNQELGEKFDQKLTGVSAGDKLNFSIKYREDFEDEDLAGLTVKYSITIKKILEEVAPELTDAFVKKNLDYDSYNDMKTAIKEELENDHATQSEENLRESLLTQVVSNSKVEKYSDELYKDCKQSLEDMYNGMAEFSGQTLEEYYKINHLTEAQRKDDLLDVVYRSIVVEAIAAQEGLVVTDSEYKEAVKTYATEEGYDSQKDFLEHYSEKDIKSWILEDKVLDFLEKNATITEKEVTADSEE